MTTVSTTQPSSAAPNRVLPLETDGVRLTHRSDRGVTVVRAIGEFDAHNHKLLIHYVRKCIEPRHGLVVDLSDLSFLGTQGLQALFAIGAECRTVNIGWTLVASPPVTRLLQIADPEKLLPTTPSVTEAVDRLSHPSVAGRPLLQLVPQSG